MATGQAANSLAEVVLEKGAKCGKDGGALRHYWYHVNGS